MGRQKAPVARLQAVLFCFPGFGRGRRSEMDLVPRTPATGLRAIRGRRMSPYEKSLRANFSIVLGGAGAVFRARDPGDAGISAAHLDLGSFADHRAE